MESTMKLYLESTKFYGDPYFLSLMQNLGFSLDSSLKLESFVSKKRTKKSSRAEL